jgi:hypothetical protein
VLEAEQRFTLVTLDAVTRLDLDDLYVEIILWSKRNEQLAAESLYEAE